jgi:VCBS repeat-containing protein
MLASVFVGRVGGLAVALGIGSGVAIGGMGAAWAAPTDSSASADSADSASGATSTRSTTDRTSVRQRGARSARAAELPAAADPMHIGNPDGSVVSPDVAPGRASRASSVPPQKVRASNNNNGAAAETVVPALSAPSQNLPDQRLALPTVAERPASVVMALVTAASPAAPVLMTPVAEAPATTVVPPVMVATPPRSAAAPGVVESVLAPLSGTGPVAPVEAAVSWVMVAAARRELGGPAAAQSTSPAAVPTGPLLDTDAVRSQTPARSAIPAPAAADDSAQALAKVAAATAVDPITALVEQVQAFVTQVVQAVTQVVTQVVQAVTQAVSAILNVFNPAPPNTAPIVADPTVGTPDPATGVVTGSVSASDPDGDPLSYTAPATTAKGAVVIDAATGDFSYTPTATARHGAASEGAVAGDLADSFMVTVSDGYGGTATAVVTVAVSPVNAAPVAGTPIVGRPNATTGVVTGSVTATDADGDTLTYSGSTTTAKGVVSVNAGSGAFTYTPNTAARENAAEPTATDADKIDTFTATVSDGSGGTVGVQVTVAILPATIAPTNSAPVVRTPTVGTPNATTGVVIGRINATDHDGDTLTFSGSTTTTKGSVVVASNGGFTYTPTATARHAAARIGASAAAKTDTFTVTITDGEGGVATSTVSVAISPANATPVAGTPTVATPNALTGVVTGNVTATDADNDTLTFSTPATTTKGAVILNSGTGAFTYTPSETSRGIAGTDTFTVTVIDGHGGSVTVPVSVPITVAPQQGNLTFRFNYGSGSQYWTPEAKESLQSAAEELASYFVVSTPVIIVFDVTAENSPGSGALASAGSDLTSSRAGFYDTVVQNKILTGVDSNGSAADGEIDVNFGIPWAYGDLVDGSQYDFTSTTMHEILHTMGFLSYLEEPGSRWNATETNWATFDSFIVTDAEVNVIGDNYRWDTSYDRNLTGRNGGLYFGGPNAVAAYGDLVPLFTPRPYEPGSSMSHLDDDTFVGVQSQMMNAYAPEGLGVRVLSAVELGILEDLGYTVVPVPGTASAMLFIGFVFLRRRKREALLFD